MKDYCGPPKCPKGGVYMGDTSSLQDCSASVVDLLDAHVQQCSVLCISAKHMAEALSMFGINNKVHLRLIFSQFNSCKNHGASRSSSHILIIMKLCRTWISAILCVVLLFKSVHHIKWTNFLLLDRIAISLSSVTLQCWYFPSLVCLFV